MTWLLVRTTSRRELTFQKDAKDIGVDVYIPLSRYRTKRTKRKRSAVGFRAAFPGYAFLSINIVVDRVALRKLKGYRGILHIMGEELRVSDKEIDMLKARQLRGEFDDLGRDNEIRFRIGEKVIIDEGPFRGNYAVLRAFPGKAFMMAEVELLSYQNRVVKLPLSFLR